MKLIATVIFATLFVLLQIECQAQSYGNALWTKTFSAEEVVETAHLSDNAKFVVLGFGFQISCVNSQDGKVLWSKKFKEDYPGKHSIVTWVDSNTVIVPTDKTIDWVEAQTGKILGSVPVLGESLEDLTSESGNYGKGFVRIEVTRYGNVLFVPFETGYYLLDILDKKIIYTSKEEATEMLVEHWGSTVLFYSAEMEKAIVFNSIDRKLIYEHTLDGEELDQALYHHIVCNGNTMALLLEDKILCIDYANGKRIGLINENVEEIINYMPLILDDKLYLLVQNEDYLTMYDIQKAKKVWNREASDDNAELMYAYTVEDNQVLIFTTNSTDLMAMEWIDGVSGKPKWKRALGEVDFSYKSGLRYVKQAVGNTKFGGVIYSSRGFGGYDLDSIGVQTYFSQTRADSTSPWNSLMRNHLFTDRCIRVEEKSAGQALLLKENDNTLIIAIVGKDLKAAWGKEVEEDDNGEAVLVVDKLTGIVKSSTRVPFFRDYEYPTSLISLPVFVQAIQAIRYPFGSAILGTHTFALISDSGKVDTLGFNTERLTWIDRGVDYVSLAGSNEDEEFTKWFVSVKDGKLERSLISMSNEKKYFNSYNDTTLHDISLRYDEPNNTLYGYDKLSDVPKKWPSPKWVLNNDAIEKLNLGDFDFENDNSVAGILQHDGKTFIFGETAFAAIDNKTGCSQSIPWNGEDDDTETTNWGFIPFEENFVFDLDEDLGLGRFTSDCKVEILGRDKSDDRKTVMFFSKHYKTVVFIEFESNRVDLFKL